MLQLSPLLVEVTSAVPFNDVAEIAKRKSV